MRLNGSRACVEGKHYEGVGKTNNNQLVFWCSAALGVSSYTFLLYFFLLGSTYRARESVTVAVSVRRPIPDARRINRAERENIPTQNRPQGNDVIISKIQHIQASMKLSPSNIIIICTTSGNIVIEGMGVYRHNNLSITAPLHRATYCLPIHQEQKVNHHLNICHSHTNTAGWHARERCSM